MRLVTAMVLGLTACSGDGSDTDNASTADTSALEFPDVEMTDPLTTIAPQFDWTEVQVMQGKRFKYLHHVPDDAIGIVWAFHGNHGNLASVQQTEWVVLYNQLVLRGIGVVLTESIDEKGAWAEQDLDRVVTVFDELVADEVVSADIPMGALAFSGGTSMTKLIVDRGRDEGWDWRAASLHQGGQMADGLPTIFVAAENDESGRVREQYVDRGLMDQCRASADDCRLREGKEVPLDPLRMARLPGVTQERAPDFFDDLVRLQFVDIKGNRRLTFDTPESVDAHLDRYVQLSRMGARAYDSASQLRVVWATHRFSSEFAQEEANFFWTYMR